MVQASPGRWIENEVIKKMVFHKLAFITLTVSDPNELLTAREAYHKIFKHLLAWLRRTKGVNTYVWKAELQKNGQIHYHITTPAFINCFELRDKWNNLQRKAGLLDSFKRKHGHDDANSTDIHAVNNVNDLAAYMIKYMCKEDDTTPAAQVNNDKDFAASPAIVFGAIMSGYPSNTKAERILDGKVWDCSANLSGAKYHSLHMTADHEQFIKEAQENDLCEVYHDERFSIIKFYEPPEEHLLSKAEFATYKTYLQVIRDKIVVKKKPKRKKKPDKPLCSA